MEYILEVKNLCKTYVVNKRQNNVLKNVNFRWKEERWLRLWDRPVRENQHCCIPFQG